MTDHTLLTVDRLSVGYHGGRIKAVNDVSFAVGEGEFVAIIGPNGAGKSSLLRAIAGLLGRDASAIRSGDICLRNVSIKGRRPHRIVQGGVALVPEQDKVFLDLTPNEHFRIMRARRQSSSAHAAAVARALELFPTVAEHLDRPAGTFSGGQRQMLGIAAALVGEPDLLMVDEFSQGLAPIVVGAVSTALREINSRGTTIVLVEQNPRLALDLADTVHVMDAGRFVASGRSEELESSSGLVGAYLGTSSLGSGDDD